MSNRGKAPTPAHYLKLGLLTIPVKLYAAARNTQAELINVHKACAEEGKDASLGILKKCKGCQATLTDDLITKAYQTATGTYLFFDAAELDAIASETDKSMEILAFAPLSEVNPLHFGPSNYLGPVEPASMRAFQLIHRQMLELKIAAITQYHYRGRDKVGIILANVDTLVLFDSFYVTEVREFSNQNKVPFRPAEFSPDELSLARDLIKQHAQPFNVAMATITDGYADRLQARIDEKIADPASSTPAAAAGPDMLSVSDLLGSLKQSLAASTRKPPTKTTAPRPADAITAKATKRKSA